MNGVAFAIVMGVVTEVWFHNPIMAVIAGLAMVINLIVAAVAGILIPLGLDKMGFDPAASSVVFLTTVTRLRRLLQLPGTGDADSAPLAVYEIA